MSGVGCMYSSINILISDVVIRITSIKALSAINLLIVGFAELWVHTVLLSLHQQLDQINLR